MTVIESSYPYDGALDLWETLRFALPRNRLLLRSEEGRATYTQWTPTGPATVSIRVAEEVVVIAHGEGAESAVGDVPRLLGLDDEPAGFDPGDGPLREMHRRSLGLRLGSSGRVFDTILPAVLGQRVTTGEAKQSYGRLVRAYGETAPGEGDLRLPPLPDRIASVPPERFRELGIEQARARLVAEVARRAGRLEEIVSMTHSDAERRLLALPGIGPWTAALVMGAAWGDRDAVPVGDYHLPNTVAWALAGEPRATDERMLELLEPFRPQRRRAVLLIKQQGGHAPRYGPRTSRSIISR